MDRCPLAGVLEDPELLQLGHLVPIARRPGIDPEGRQGFLGAVRGDLDGVPAANLPPRLRAVLHLARAWFSEGERKAEGD